MKYPITTYKILMDKAFNRNIDESWIDWAIEMMEAGYESDNLYILAGETKPYNQFQIQDLTDKVLKDLKLNYEDKVCVTKDYIYFLFSSSIDVPENYMGTLRELRDIYYDTDMSPDYVDFALLYWAKQDLIGDENQWYWPDADRGNIDQIIKNEFQEWIRQYEDNKKPTQ